MLSLLPASLLVAALTPLGQASPVSLQPRQDCTNPVLRVEWRELGADNQKAYLDSVKCLKTKPSRIGLSTSLYDDFPYVHFKLSKQIHGCAAFLPWHRWFSKIYEDALRQDCDYQGPMTYWDWTLDARKLLQSPVMSTPLGFGGNSSDTRTDTLPDGKVVPCVTEGPFADLRPSWIAIDPNDMREQAHCLFRNVVDGDTPDAVSLANAYNATNIAIVQREETFGTYARLLEGSPHGSIHASLGGEMNPTTSPNEPLFFLHHPQIDRIWWLWIEEDREKRLQDYSGWKVDANGQFERNATLDDTLTVMGLVPDITVREVMDTSATNLCYRY